MADKKITELDVSQTIAADDSVFANVNGSARQVAVSLILALLEDVYATLESPAFTGSPTVPTPADTDDSTRIATTAFLKSVLEDYAKLASPTFTGIPKAPTASTSTNTTQIATTAYVKAQKYATLDSPTLTGTPKTSTPASTDDSTRIPTTGWVKDRIAEANTGGESGGSDYELPQASASALGGIKANARSSSSETVPVYVDTNTGFAYVKTYPDISGLAPLNSPEFTNPKTNNPGIDSNDTSIPNTQWVRWLLSQAQTGGLSVSYDDTSGNIVFSEGGTSSGGGSGWQNYETIYEGDFEPAVSITQLIDFEPDDYRKIIFYMFVKSDGTKPQMTLASLCGAALAYYENLGESTAYPNWSWMSEIDILNTDGTIGIIRTQSKRTVYGNMSDYAVASGPNIQNHKDALMKANFSNKNLKITFSADSVEKVIGISVKIIGQKK